jgi:hypothetical protein
MGNWRHNKARPNTKRRGKMKKLKHRGKIYHEIPVQNRSSKLPSRMDILADMEKIFQLAIAAGKLSVALRAKELIELLSKLVI